MQYLKSIYLQLVRELLIINCSPLSCLERTELSFQTSLVNFQKLSMALNQKDWHHRQWICINKHIRSEIITLAEYFLLVHHALLFEPPDIERAIVYWKREHKRLAVFCRSHTSFYRYHKSGSFKKDNFYFKFPSHHYFPGNNCLQPKGDVLRGKLNALLLYNTFVHNELKRLQKLKISASHQS
jgi:hypothetical protein